MTDQPTFWGSVRAALRWLAVKIGAPGVALLVVAIGVFFAAIGWKELQIGGLLSKLLGSKPDSKAESDAVNTIPPGRVGANGQLIPQGTPDSKGDTQAIVVPIKEPGLFSNPDTVKFTPPDGEKTVEVRLPDGVKSRDVENVVVVKPNVYVVAVKDNSGVSTKTIDDLLSKYGS